MAKARNRETIEGLPVKHGRHISYLLALLPNPHWEDFTENIRGNSMGRKRPVPFLKLAIEEGQLGCEVGRMSRMLGALVSD